jgi:uncharacterized protein YdeI (BOF family)
LKKLMLLAALLALLALAVAPAIAQVATQEGEQGADSGDLNQRSDVTGGGDNSSQCANPQIAGNTGNSQNQDQIIQYASEGEFEFEDSGSTITVSPTNTTSCNQQVNQAASASGH